MPSYNVSRDVSSGDRERGCDDDSGKVGEKASEALEGHLNQVKSSIAVVERATLEQPTTMRRFFKMVETMDLPTEDLTVLEANFSIAHAARLRDKTGLSFISHLKDALVSELQRVQPIEGQLSEIPSLDAAPQEFRGVRADGDPYEFLLEHYAPWLQDGRKCLDRPLLQKIDSKLLKAIQQRYTRGREPRIPQLSEIFASKVEAARNRKIYMVKPEA